MELQASRLRARTGPDGEPVLLLDQDRTRWDRLLIQRGLANIDRIERLGGTVGPYALQAAIAACHARATVAEDTDWEGSLRCTTASRGSARRRSLSSTAESRPPRHSALRRAWRSCCRCSMSRSMRNYHLLYAVAGDLLCRSWCARAGPRPLPARGRAHAEQCGANDDAEPRRQCAARHAISP